jgi:signal transduction histidine kinase
LRRQLADAIQGRTRLDVGVSVLGDVPILPSEVQVALYRLAQEALNNVVKHAQTHHVALELSDLPDRGVRLSIADDGCGFDPDTVPAGHLGLGIMRERTNAIGARLWVSSRPGQGTSITVDWQQTEDAQQ